MRVWPPFDRKYKSKQDFVKTQYVLSSQMVLFYNKAQKW